MDQNTKFILGNSAFSLLRQRSTLNIFPTHIDRARGSHVWAFQEVLVIKNPPANAGDAGDVGSIPELGRSLE